MFRPRSYADVTAAEIDQAIKNYIDEAYVRARAILEQNQGILKSCAKELLMRETLTTNELAALTGKLVRPADTAAPLLAAE